MKSIEEFKEVLIFQKPVDMRKYRNGLVDIILSECSKSIYEKVLFVFSNKQRNIIRFLYWDYTGFAIWTKNLDKDKYKWPRQIFEEQTAEISKKQLLMLLRGMDISEHKKLVYESVL